jgi:hypothetical protein
LKSAAEESHQSGHQAIARFPGSQDCNDGRAGALAETGIQWTGTSDTFNPKSAHKVIDALVKRAVMEFEKEAIWLTSRESSEVQDDRLGPSIMRWTAASCPAT